MHLKTGLVALVLSLAGCATDTPDARDVSFGTGSQEELATAEELAYEAVFADAGPAMMKNVADLRTEKVHVDVTSMAHTKFRQLVDGVPVWGGEAIVHLAQDGALAGITDSLVGDVQVDTTPTYTADEAIDFAVASLPTGWEKITDDAQADLWVLRHEGKDHLVWRVQLRQINLEPGDAMPVVFVDAHTGDVVWQYDNLQSAACSGATNYYGTVSVDCYTDGASYYLEDTGDLLGTYTWNNGTRSLYYVSSTSTTFSNTTAVNKNAFEAAYSAQAVHDYYLTTHGRNGIDGAGGPGYISSHGYNFITSGTSYSRNYANAFWDGNMMTYGDGDGVTASSLTTLDIAGHEMTHGVTDYEAGLVYSGESGGLNESMSDVFGAMVERSVLGESADTWMVGEDAWTPATAGDALRYMDAPHDDGYSYDYYSSSLSSADVHYTSGVGNLAFYLLAQGGTHPRGTSTTVVTGIGADAAADIWYLALTSYMTSTTNYSAARTATLSAAAALYGSSSNEYTQVGNAWTAVGVGVAPTCTTATYSSSLSKAGRTNYHPSSSGTSVTVASQTVSLTGPATANFQLYLEKLSGRTWSVVGSSTNSGSTESISYSGSSGTYRTSVYSASGTGSYTVSWCK